MENTASFPFGFDPSRAARRLRFAAEQWGQEHGRQHRGGRRGHHGRDGGWGGWGGGFGGFPFGGPGQRWGRRGGRASRGDIRLAALALLADQPMHGYQLMREIADRTEGLWRPSPGAVYPALQQLEDEGLVTADKAEGKRVFRLTEEGTRYVAEHREEIDGVWDAVGEDVDESWLELAEVGKQVAQAFMQVATAGTRRQRAEARDIMADTRRKLYRILAEDAPEQDTQQAGPQDTTE
jgi:DNA-binding PadR family transcriptional regulator